MNIALYARVSTTRQAENDLSIPDQLRQMRVWAERHGHVVVKEYIEPGASATDDKRPVFQEMMADAAVKPAPYQAVVVHSLSRFFRDLVMGAMYQKTLKKVGVQLVSITQQTQDDPSGDMQRHIFMLFDEYQSKEIAKHTLRGMQENARQGYFNGSRAPFGYQTVDAGQTGPRGRMKKKLAIHEEEAETVRDIFALYTVGIVGCPRIGMKEIAKRLNGKGILNRGKPWRIQKVGEVLASTTYAGFHVFNQKDSKTFKAKDEAEWIKVPIPAIVPASVYEAAAKLRDAWSPKKCVPRRETSPNLLMGLLKCGHCGASMSVVTGKGGRYRYYKCNGRMSKGNSVCPSKNFPLEKIDSLVLKAFRETIYTPEHIGHILQEFKAKLAEGAANGDAGRRLKALELELAATETAQNKLFEAVEKGLLDLDDQLRERAKQHKEARQKVLDAIAALKRQTNRPTLTNITPQKIEAVAKVLNKKLSSPSPYARAYLRATLTEIRITDDLLKLSGGHQAMAGLVANNAEIAAATAVPNFIHGWRPLRDSNPCYYRERVMS